MHNISSTLYFTSRHILSGISCLLISTVAEAQSLLSECRHASGDIIPVSFEFLWLKSIKDKKKQTKSNIKAEFITESVLTMHRLKRILCMFFGNFDKLSCRRMQIRNIQYSYRPTYMKATGI